VLNEIPSIFFALIQGLKAVAGLFLIVIIVSIPLGFLITMLMQSSLKFVQWFCKAFICVIRGTPLMLQLFFIYFGLPYIPVIGKHFILSGFTSAAIGFSINYAAYFSEIFRGGLLSVDIGQYEAARSLGLNHYQTLKFIIIPQMIRVVIPSITNEAITLVKDTSLMFAIAVPEVLHYAKVAVSRTNSVLPFIVAFMIYLIINAFIQIALSFYEKRSNKGWH